MKSNNQTGPGAAFTVTKNNVFGGGESWNVKLNGSYEWQTGKASSSLMNSYELGISTSLIFRAWCFLGWATVSMTSRLQRLSVYMPTR